MDSDTKFIVYLLALIQVVLWVLFPQVMVMIYLGIVLTMALGYVVLRTIACVMWHRDHRDGR